MGMDPARGGLDPAVRGKDGCGGGFDVGELDYFLVDPRSVNCASFLDLL